jgi:hypothetical protein
MTGQNKILLGSILLLLASMASAQTKRVAVSVPFPFVAGHQALPAGQYTIEQDGMLITLRSGDRRPTVLLAAYKANAVENKKSYLLFREQGAHYFLAEIWREGAGQYIAPGKLERELTFKRNASEVARVEARLAPQ